MRHGFMGYLTRDLLEKANSSSGRLLQAKVAMGWTSILPIVHVSMALFHVGLLLLILPACRSAPTDVDQVSPNSRPCGNRHGRQFISCIGTCVEGEPKQVCFCGHTIRFNHDPSVNPGHYRPSPILPWQICKHMSCLKSPACGPEETSFPYYCRNGHDGQQVLGRRSSMVHCLLEDWNAKQMADCYFNPAQGTSTSYTHGQEVRFEVTRKNSDVLKSRRCLCYNGKWISRSAIGKFEKNVNLATTPTRFLCSVNDSTRGKFRYLRVRSFTTPTFRRDDVFNRKARKEELELIASG